MSESQSLDNSNMSDSQQNRISLFSQTERKSRNYNELTNVTNENRKKEEIERLRKIEKWDFFLSHASDTTEKEGVLPGERQFVVALNITLKQKLRIYFDDDTPISDIDHKMEINLSISRYGIYMFT